MWRSVCVRVFFRFSVQIFHFTCLVIVSWETRNSLCSCWYALVSVCVFMCVYYMWLQCLSVWAQDDAHAYLSGVANTQKNCIIYAVYPLTQLLKHHVFILTPPQKKKKLVWQCSVVEGPSQHRDARLVTKMYQLSHLPGQVMSCVWCRYLQMHLNLDVRNYPRL